ncbi:hypothetical protein HYH03_007473 [Edaphochlamys debaryana]|uniref:Uncharacterized protein n=1 Tax=Edaphochlamys debaryana TaxID=47281 RepID=A0A835Y5A0_9CHLO|nr:hypothetical protein HYH03_007473 [Edaphochlamys debaryana]|eukprot:KAG2494421.1 hypothetical protein HYH03_007473 [Edaphochlamys debaryana]
MSDPLDRAARAGPPAKPILMALLAAGANPKANESRSLQIACETAVQQAPKRGAGGATEAGAEDRLVVVRCLLDAGADPRVCGSICLTLAARAGDLELAQLLLAAGANPSAASGRALTAAAGAVDETMVEVLLQPGWEHVPVGNRGDALQAVCASADLAADMAAVEAAKAGAVAAEDCGSGQAQESARNGDEPGPARLARRLSVVRRLLAVGSAPVVAASHALLAAAESGCTELLHLMLKAGASVNSNFGCVLRIASRRGDTAVVGALLAAGADAAACQSDALKLAAEGGHDAIVRMLMKHGANPCDNFHAPFLAAVRSGSTEVVEAMLTAGADPRLHNNLAIQVACRMGLEAMARVLLQHGADPTVNGSAALLDASKAGHEGVVRLLLEDGRVDVRARDGWALQAAEYEGWGGIQQLLREAMRAKR